MTKEELREQYENETGEKWFIAPVCHGDTGFASWEYQTWLEEKASRDSRQLSAAPSEAVDNLLRDLVDEIMRWDDSIEDIQYRINNNCHLHRVIMVAKKYLTERGIAG